METINIKLDEWRLSLKVLLVLYESEKSLTAGEIARMVYDSSMKHRNALTHVHNALKKLEALKQVKGVFEEIKNRKGKRCQVKKFRITTLGIARVNVHLWKRGLLNIPYEERHKRWVRIRFV